MVGRIINELTYFVELWKLERNSFDPLFSFKGKGVALLFSPTRRVCGLLAGITDYHKKCGCLKPRSKTLDSPYQIVQFSAQASAQNASRSFTPFHEPSRFLTALPRQ